MGKVLIDFVQKRQESIERKRRNFERIMFQNFLGCYSVIDRHSGPSPIRIVDISETGMLFQVPWNPHCDQKFETDQELTIRLYFTKDSYILAIVKVKYTSQHTDKAGNKTMRYGCELDQSNQTFEALKSFIDFIYKFAEHCSEDKGENKTYFL